MLKKTKKVTFKFSISRFLVKVRRPFEATLKMAIHKFEVKTIIKVEII